MHFFCSWQVAKAINPFGIVQFHVMCASVAEHTVMNCNSNRATSCHVCFSCKTHGYEMQGVDGWGNSCSRAIGGSTSTGNRSCRPSLGLTSRQPIAVWWLRYFAGRSHSHVVELFLKMTLLLVVHKNTTNNWHLADPLTTHSKARKVQKFLRNIWCIRRILKSYIKIVLL